MMCQLKHCLYNFHEPLIKKETVADTLVFSAFGMAKENMCDLCLKLAIKALTPSAILTESVFMMISSNDYEGKLERN